MEAMESQYRGRVDVDSALEGAASCIRNARDLVRDAKFLRDNGSPARAIFLSVIAIEELGKLPKLANFGRYARQQRWRDFWKAFRNHVDKLDLHGTVMALSQSLDDEEKRAWLYRKLTLSPMHDLKMSALYTDWRDGGFRCPADLPDLEITADQLIQLAEEGVAFHSERWAGYDREALLQLQDRMVAFKSPEQLMTALEAFSSSDLEDRH